MQTRLITPPAAEPVSLLEACQHLRLADTQVEADALPDKSLIEALILTARSMAEEITGRQLMPATWELLTDEFIAGIELPKQPIQSITSITYRNDTTIATLADTQYLLDTAGGRLVTLTPDDAVAGLNSVQIKYVSGYTDAAAVPAPIKAAIKMMLGHWYENRQDVTVGTIAPPMPMASQYLLAPYRILSF